MHNNPYEPLVPPPPDYDPELYQPTYINLPRQAPRRKHKQTVSLLIGTTILLLILALGIVPVILSENHASAIHAISRTSTTIQPISTTPALPWHVLVTFPTSTDTAQPTSVSMPTTAPYGGTQQPLATQQVQPSATATSIPVATSVPTPSPTDIPTQEPTTTTTATAVPTATATQLPAVEPSPVPTSPPTVASNPTDPAPTSVPTVTPIPTQPVPTSTSTMPTQVK